MKIIKRLFLCLVVIILFLVLIYFFIMRPHKIIGNSMHPNVLNGEYLIAEKVSYIFSAPKRGDIVLIKQGGINYIVRIIGLPNEKLKFVSNKVYIDNELLNEIYLDNSINTDSGIFGENKEVSIPKKQYFVLGDNRAHAQDSSEYGFIDIKDIKSKAFYAYWPTSKKGFVK